MGKNPLTLEYKVTCNCQVRYPNEPLKAHTGQITIAQFAFKQHAEDFTGYCLNGYYTGVKVEKT